MDTWYEVRCPACDTQNMAYSGDPNDPTGCDDDALKCYGCERVLQLTERDGYDADFLEIGRVRPRKYENFLKLPITFMEKQPMGEWTRDIERQGTVEELLKTWDIDDPTENSEMAQVLRHLRRVLNDD